MKNYLMFALLICATASMAFGQAGVADAAKVTVACPDDECHVAPYFQGEGGFVGMLADGFDEVNFVVTCGNVSTSAKADVSADGVVTQLFSMDNGLACGSAGGSIEIHGVMDGGWYWVTDDMNSAVSSLMPKDAMGNMQVTPADPMSDDIMLTSVEGGSATFVKQMSTGRVGIIPHVVPEPPMPDPLDCGLYVDGNNYRTRMNDCMLEVDFAIRGAHADSAGRANAVTVGSMVYRQAVGDLVITFNVYGTGHISTGACPAAGYNVPFGDCASNAGRAPLSAIWDVARTDTTAGTATLGDVGIATDASGSDQTEITVTISPLASCAVTSTAGLVQSFRVDAITPTTANTILPDLPGNHRNSTVAMINKSITVACPPASSANQGQELVPDNPFPPTTE
ncbi:MAG: hypothetical protein OYL92_10460 [Acidobacteriota bacterium]|nr:hypothetical protein [Acidobacteriota bacterium]MDE3265380.1 hypothetical protein [Acidobacteriota bacterium]